MKKLLKKINSDKVQNKIVKIPYIFILLLVIVLPPIGVWFLVTKVTKSKRKIYHNKRFLLWLCVFIFFIMGLGIYYKIKEIINLCDSGMSLDMINFIPEDIHLYLIGIIMCISYIIGIKKLKREAKIQRVYTKLININHITSLEEISNRLGIKEQEVKENIKLLVESEYLLPIKIDNKTNEIIYDVKKRKSKKEIKNNKQSKLIKCHKCGAFIRSKKDEYVECDFCGNGLIDIEIK